MRCWLCGACVQHPGVGQVAFQRNPFEAQLLDYLLQNMFLGQQASARNKRVWGAIAIGAAMCITPWLLHQLRIARSR